MEHENIYYCIGCGKTHNKKDFYKSYNPNHKNGVYPFCKDYIKKEVYREDRSINVEKFKNLLMQMDAPFLESEFEKAKEVDKETIGFYFTIIKLKQNRNLTWKDSVFINENNELGEENQEEDIDEDLGFNIDNLSEKDIRRLKNKWGFGYSTEELYLFEKKYRMLRNNYEEKTAMHREALLNYIRYRVKEEMATADGNVKEAKEWGELANKASTAAKINPSQLSKADLSGGLSTFSELSEAVEKEVDIIQILPKFKYRPNDALDFNIWCYVNYIRDLKGLPLCEYEDVYKFYDERKKDYIKQYGDPYGIFKDDPTEKNRENIKKFINEGDA